MSQTPQTDVQLGSLPLHRVAARVFDTPLLIHEGKLHQILQALGPRLGLDLAHRIEAPATLEPAQHQLAAEKMAGGMPWKWNREGGYYNVGNTAVIPVLGTLVQRSSWLDSLSGMQSYQSIESSVVAAMNDPSVESLIFEYDSPGGEAAGAFDLADRLASLRGQKPMTAVVNELAASAAYLLASTADEIVVPRTGYAGSVGVVTAHADYSQQLEKKGIVVTFIYAGAKKIDGNPYQPLDDRVRAEWQAAINEMYGLFTGTVASNRKMPEAAVRGTEAGMFMGRAAVEAGFADSVNTLANVVHNVSLRRGGAFRLSKTSEVATMTDAEKAEREQAIAAARAEGVAQGKKDAGAELTAAVAKARTDERARIKGIITSEEASGRGDLALHLAFETEQSVEASAAVLKAAPQAQAKGKLAEAMAKLGTPGIRSTDAPEQPAKVATIDVAGAFGKLNAPYERAIAGGHKPGQAAGAQ